MFSASPPKPPSKPRPKRSTSDNSKTALRDPAAVRAPHPAFCVSGWTDAFAGALTRGSIGTIPASEETKNTQRYWGGSVADERSQRRTGLRVKFPANRENNREFYKNWAVWRNCARQNAAESVSCRTIPYKMKQGINSRRTGNLLSRAGNLQRLAGNCRPCAGFRQNLSRPSPGRAATPTRRLRTSGRVLENEQIMYN